MSRFYKKFWKRKSSRKSAFGGTVKSQEEVNELSAKIKAHEKAEMEAFEEDFDARLKEL